MGRGSGTYNPYTPDSGVRPPELPGRDRELGHLRNIITQLQAGGTEKHALITGLRGVGKTVLLNEFEVMCQEAGWYADTKEIGRTTDLKRLAAGEVRKSLLQMSAKERRGDKVRSALAALKAFEISFGGFGFKLEIDAAVGMADSGDLIEDLRDLVVSVGQAADEAGVGLALILDEVHNLDRNDFEALIMALHRAKQKRLPVVFVGAGLPLLPTLAGEAKSYAERMFIWPSIGALPEAEARAALVLPAERQGIDWEDDATAEVLDYTDGYPYFIQEYGRHAWVHDSGATITLDAVLGCREVLEADLDDYFFELRIGRLSDLERSYAGAMASLGDGPQRTGHVASALGRTLQSLSTVRDELLRSAVIYSPRRGYVDFTVPHCAAFVRRQYPL